MSASMVYVKTKSLFTSKMFWLGVAEVLAGVTELITEAIADSKPVGVAFIAKGLLTIILRIQTKTPVRTPLIDDVPAKEVAGTKTEPRG